MGHKYGEKVLGIANDYIVVGYYVGAFKKLNGDVVHVLQLSPVSDQIFCVKKITEYSEEAPKSTSGLIIRDRSDEPAKRILPPLSNGGKY